MTITQIRNYSSLTEFLGRALGPDYEVALHDLEDMEHSLVAIANNHVSGREIGAPLTDVALRLLAEQKYEKNDYKIHYKGLADNGKILRSSTLFIRNDVGKPVGMLCINFDDSRYQELSERILGLCHPNQFVDSNFAFNIAPHIMEEDVEIGIEHFANSSQNVAESAIRETAQALGVDILNCSADEKQAIVNELEKRGVFLLKGAVKEVAEILNCSIATMYRYIAKAKEETIG